MKINKTIAFSSLILAPFSHSCSGDEAKTQNTIPNILFIIVDDQGYADLSAYEHSARDASTPHMDRLATEGILFTRAYVTSPVCSPSRAGMVTGRYQQQWGGWRYRTGLPDDVQTIAEYFRQGNYVTGMIGKNDLGRNHGSQTAREYPLNHGYQYFVGFQYLWHEYFVIPQDCQITSPAYGPLLYNEGKMDLEYAYTTDLFTDSAIAFIERNRENPFLLTLSYNAVHDIVQQLPEKYLKKWNLPAIPNYDCNLEDYKVYYERYKTVGETPMDEMRKYYLANLNCLDDNIGRLLAAMDKFGLTENTVVIYIGDNGGSPQTNAINYPLSGSKFTLHEGGIRVPMMMRWPAMLPANIVCNEIVSALDILPTCLDAANINIPDNLDGISIISPLKNDPADWPARPMLYFDYSDQFAVIEGDWKLVKAMDVNMYHGGLERFWPTKSENPRLYNLKQDPGELIDLYNLRPDIVERFMHGYNVWHDQMRSEARRRGWHLMELL